MECIISVKDVVRSILEISEEVLDQPDWEHCVLEEQFSNQNINLSCGYFSTHYLTLLQAIYVLDGQTGMEFAWRHSAEVRNCLPTDDWLLQIWDSLISSHLFLERSCFHFALNSYFSVQMWFHLLECHWCFSLGGFWPFATRPEREVRKGSIKMF